MKRRLNICIISPEYPPKTNWGGTATFNHNLAKVIKKLGHTVHIITLDPESQNFAILRSPNEQIHYITLKSRSKLFNYIYYKFPFGILRIFLQKYFSDILFLIDWNIFSFLYFRQLVKSNKIDLIHSPSYLAPALLIKIFNSKIKNLVHLHGTSQLIYLLPKNPNLGHRLYMFIENIYLTHFADHIISCSKDIRSKFIKQFPKTRGRVIHLRNFLNTDEYVPSKIINKNNLIFYGRMEYRKGVDMLIESFINLALKQQAIKLFLIGDSDQIIYYKNKYLAFFEFLGLLDIPIEIRSRIFIFPRINDKNTLNYLLSSIGGIVVNPARYEPFGLTTIESMALKLPVIASRYGGGEEIINNKVDGLLIKPSVKELTKAIVMIRQLKNRDLKKLTENGYKKVEKEFSVSSAFVEYRALYKNILSDET